MYISQEISAISYHHMIAEHIRIRAHLITIATSLSLLEGPLARLTELDRRADLKRIFEKFRMIIKKKSTPEEQCDWKWL